ncbi:ABC transporter ATP-binding protein [Brevibacterium sp. S22]|nr:ABC transporter ATP-binding protein [Brevibacterium sp. S22]TGD26987.1 ABC transporter ATP-binding protein [Brevibacterium sp. S22]
MSENQSTTVLSVRDLSVGFRVGGQLIEAVRCVNFDLAAGEALAIVGESGSGKSVTSLAALGLLPPNAEIAGEIRIGGVDVIGAGPAGLASVRGTLAAMIFQDPFGALDPVFTVGYQLTEMLRHHRREMSKQERSQRAVELLKLVEIPEPEVKLASYPHQLSGGQAQRVMIAIALACDPAVLIADEPTTALDVTVQRDILDVLHRLRERLGTAIVMITHDMGVVADFADRVVVMRDGRVEETAPSRQLFSAPRAEYTRALLAAVPRIGAGQREHLPEDERTVLEIENLTVEYRGRRGRNIRSVDDVSFRIREGEMLGLVGESGSGKSSIGKSIIGLAPVSGGRITISGRDISALSRREMRKLKSHIGFVFQNPSGALDPRRTIGQAIAAPLRVHDSLTSAQLSDRVSKLLESVELPAHWSARYPHELSGGQSQRVSIARALALDPSLLIADEPTSALDVSVQATVLDLLRRLQHELHFACLFISHDLAVVDSLCDQVLVLKEGVSVEHGERSQILSSPQHPYTHRLLSAVPYPDPDKQRRRREDPLAG